MLRRIIHSAAFRSAPLFRAALHVSATPRYAKPPNEDFALISMTDRDHLFMCEQMIASVNRAWSEVPRLELLIDTRKGNVDTTRIQKLHSAAVTIVTWGDVEKHHADGQRADLITFARENLLGRKLAFILASVERQKTLWVDNDVLFFRDFIPLVRAQPDGVFIGATRDMTFGRSDPLCSYAPQLARHLFGEQALVPLINSGLCLGHGNIYDEHHLAALIQRTLDTKEQSYFTEQTVIAWAALHSRGVLWEEPVIHLDDSDIQTLSPTYKGQIWHARHYTGNVRHLFWRDAFFLRHSHAR
jgi:hypothetical protein